MSDIGIQLLHWLLFAASIGSFGIVMYKRGQVMRKAQKSQFPMVSLLGKIGASFVNFWLQVKLYRHPVRGFAHGIMFYGFIIYALHSLSQIIAGIGWLGIQSQGLDPINFSLVEAIHFPLIPLTESQRGISLLLIPVLIAGIAKFFVQLQVKAKDGIGNAGLQGSPLLQWGAIFAISPLFFVGFLIILTSGKEFYEDVLYAISLLVFVAIAIFSIRRWFLKAEGLDTPSQQSFIILLLIAVLMISTLGLLAAQSFLSSPEQEVSAWYFLPTMLISFVTGTDPIAWEASAHFFWWVHLGTVYTFMVYIPMSKHAHLLFAPLNYFFTQKRKPGEMSLMNLSGLTDENPANTESSNNAADMPDTFGAKDIHDFSWTSILDSLSCIECGRCTVQCPAHKTGKLLDPKKIMTDLKAVAMNSTVIAQSAGMNGAGNEFNLAASAASATGTSDSSALAVLNKHTSEEEIWACTACNACVEACPVGNNQLDAIMEMRRYLVLNEGTMPVELQTAMNNLEKQSNPWGIAAETRSDWCADLDVQTAADNPQADVLYWVGCAASFDERNRKIARSFVEIMQKANVNFAILGNEEKCTGDSARRAGNEYLYQTLAKNNIETLQKYSFKKIVTACPHCFNTLGNEYKQMGGNFQVEHHSEFISDLLDKDKIQITKEKQEKLKKRRLTYHDSCYLGRMNEIYKEPRAILAKSLGTSIMEAPDHGRNSMCCGAGGAQMWMEEKHTKVNHARSQQLVNTGADTIATACPFCMTMITDGVKNEEMDKEISVVDIAEVVAAGITGTGKETSNANAIGRPTGTLNTDEPLLQQGFDQHNNGH